MNIQTSVLGRELGIGMVLSVCVALQELNLVQAEVQYLKKFRGLADKGEGVSGTACLDSQVFALHAIPV